LNNIYGTEKKNNTAEVPLLFVLLPLYYHLECSCRKLSQEKDLKELFDRIMELL